MLSNWCTHTPCQHVMHACIQDDFQAAASEYLEQQNMSQADDESANTSTQGDAEEGTVDEEAGEHSSGEQADSVEDSLPLRRPHGQRRRSARPESRLFREDTLDTLINTVVQKTHANEEEEQTTFTAVCVLWQNASECGLFTNSQVTHDDGCCLGWIG